MLALLLAGLSNKGFRSALILLFHAAFTKIPMLILLGFGSMFVGAAAFLNHIIFDDFRPQIALAFWSLFAFLPTKMRLIEIEKDLSNLFDWVKALAGFTIVAQFITNYHTYNIWIELILMPITILASILILITENDKKARALNFIGVIIILLIAALFVLRSIKGIIDDPAPFFSLGTIELILAPVFYGLLAVPYFMIWAMVLRIDNLRLALRFSISNPQLRDRALMLAIAYSFLSRNQIEAFKREIQQARPETLDALRVAMRDAIEVVERTKQNFEVPFDQGWSPDIARSYLNSMGITTTMYQRDRSTESGWYADGGAKFNEGSIESPYVFYSIEGDKHVAKAIRLEVSLFSIGRREAAQAAFKATFIEVWENSMGEELPDELADAVMNCRPYSGAFKGRNLILECKEEDGSCPISEYRFELKMLESQ